MNDQLELKTEANKKNSLNAYQTSLVHIALRAMAVDGHIALKPAAIAMAVTEATGLEYHSSQAGRAVDALKLTYIKNNPGGQGRKPVKKPVEAEIINMATPRVLSRIESKIDHIADDLARVLKFEAKMAAIWKDG
ncbi:MAG: hypothetical protein GQ538_04230 [Xanthomonadales bacterium]|nr:hypothetical protein [Xanthomonadales bacterium]